MTFVALRNLIASALAGALESPVVLSNQAQPEPEYPYMVYTATAPYISNGETGDHIQRAAGGDVMDIRREQPTATISFTACSQNRETPDGYIYGDDEAQELCDRAIGWFLHGGREALSHAGAVVVDVLNVGDRSFIEIDEAARQYGFDLVVRYCRADERNTGAVGQVVLRQSKE